MSEPGPRRMDDVPVHVSGDLPVHVPAEPPAEPKAIDTLPPLEELAPAIPISQATGQPRRSKVMLVGALFLYAGAVAAAVAFGVAYWDTIHVQNWPHSIRLIRWFHPGPGTWQSVLLVCLMGLIGAVMTAAPAITGFQAWNGHRWSRVAGLVSCALAGLAVTMNDVAWLSLPLVAIGTGILFTPPVGRYFWHWQVFRTPAPPAAPRTEPVTYGPLPRYR